MTFFSANNIFGFFTAANVGSQLFTPKPYQAFAPPFKHILKANTDSSSPAKEAVPKSLKLPFYQSPPIR
ncbi:MAG TPA: hypothetical protein PKA63_14420, partial [Oligoflexia bacterium]|nr:hypothetical protein [Oligoflexia bacterium]HMP49860.1 hypothetical protein [Oligoflexia bacterium]